MDNFIAFFNNNEGFFSALLGFLAIIISVLTYRSQQKEQIKNNQENRKFQQEIAEKQNQFQADLQKRQLKLTVYNIRISYWKEFKNLYAFLVQFKNIYENIQELNSIILEYYKIGNNFPVINTNLEKIKFFVELDDKLLKDIIAINESYEIFCKNQMIIVNNTSINRTTTGEYVFFKKEYNMLEVEEAITLNVKNILSILPNLIEIIEKDLYISDIDKF